MQQQDVMFQHDIGGFKEILPNSGKVLSIDFGGFIRNTPFSAPGKEEAEEFAEHVKKVSFNQLSFRHIEIPSNLVEAVNPIDAISVSFIGASVSAEVEDKLSDFMKTRKNLENVYISNIENNSQFIWKLFHSQGSLKEVTIKFAKNLNIALLSRKICVFNLSLLKITGVSLNSMEDYWFLLKVLGTNKSESLTVRMPRMASRFSDLSTLFSSEKNPVRVELSVSNREHLNRFLLKPAFESKEQRFEFDVNISKGPVAVKNFASFLVNLEYFDEIRMKGKNISIVPEETLSARIQEAILGPHDYKRFMF